MYISIEMEGLESLSQQLSKAIADWRDEVTIDPVRINKCINLLYSDNEHVLCEATNREWRDFFEHTTEENEITHLQKFKEVWNECECERCKDRKDAMFAPNECLHMLAWYAIEDKQKEIAQLAYDIGARYLLLLGRGNWENDTFEDLVITWIVDLYEKYKIPQMRDEISYVYNKTKNEYPIAYAKNKDYIDHIYDSYCLQ